MPTPRKAVLCGVSEYVGIARPLTHVPDELRRLRAALQTLDPLCRYTNVEAHLDAGVTLGRLESILDDLAQPSALEEGDVFLHLAGHGCVRRGRPYFMTFGAQLSSPGIRLDELNDLIGKIRALRVYVVLDFCHSGALVGGLGPLTAMSMELPERVALLAACGAAESTPSGTLEPSFTSHFLQALADTPGDEEGAVSWSAISARLHRSLVTSTTRPIDRCTSLRLRERAFDRRALRDVAVFAALPPAVADAGTSSPAWQFRVRGEGQTALATAVNRSGLLVTSRAIRNVATAETLDGSRVFHADTVHVTDQLLQYVTIGVATVAAPRATLSDSLSLLGQEVTVLFGEEARGEVTTVCYDLRVQLDDGYVLLTDHFEVNLDRPSWRPGAAVTDARGAVIGIAVAFGAPGLIVAPWTSTLQARESDDWMTLLSRGVNSANQREDASNVRALRYYSEALAIAPQTLSRDMRARLLTYRGAMLKRLGRVQEAEADLRLSHALAESEHERLDAAYNLASIYAMSGRKSEMFASLEELRGDRNMLSLVEAHLHDYFLAYRDDSRLLRLLAGKEQPTPPRGTGAAQLARRRRR